MSKTNGNTQTKSPMWEQGDADSIRYSMVRSGFYPTHDTRGDASEDSHESNIRNNILPAILPLLDRNDLICICRIAEALAEWPVNEMFFEHELKRQREQMQWLVESGQVSARALAIFDEHHPEAT